jgi:hypothetical protein
LVGELFDKVKINPFDKLRPFGSELRIEELMLSKVEHPKIKRKILTTVVN